MASPVICQICGSETVGPHHVIPRSQGGADTPKNIVWLCARCHDIVESMLDDGIEFSPALVRIIQLKLGLPVRYNTASRRTRTADTAHRTKHLIFDKDGESNPLGAALDRMKEELDFYFSKVTCVRCGTEFSPDNPHLPMCPSCLKRPPPKNGIIAYNRRYWDYKTYTPEKV